MSTRQEETLALAQGLQCCTERSGTPSSGVLCKAVQDLQRCIAPLMWLDGDDIIEASLLGPGTDNRTHNALQPQRKKQYS